MLQNYFFLNRIVVEANKIIASSKIIEIFSQDKGTLVIDCKLSVENYFIEICAIPGNSYLTLKKNYSRAKKNTINFFEDIWGEIIESFQIADDDRIIKIKCKKVEIYFAIRGKYTNVFCLTKDNRFIPFKTFEENIVSEINKEFAQKTFNSDWNLIDFSNEPGEISPEELRNKFPILGKDITKELNARSRFTEQSTNFKLLENILEEIRVSKPCVFIDEDNHEINLGFENFESLPFTEKKIFNNVFEAQYFFLSKQFYFQAKEEKIRIIRKHIERELKKAADKINNLKSVIGKGSNETEYNKFGNLLLANLKSMKAGMTSISVDDIFTNGEKIKIKLNPKLSHQKNVNYYFEKSRSEKAGFAKAKELIIKAEKNFNFLQNTEESLNDAASIKDLEILMKKLKIKSMDAKETKEDISAKFKHYLIDEKYNVYVGKDSKNNDLLTTKFAKQNDYWFHARGVSGSHVVLRVENIKEPIPKNILKKTAALAAYHSKAKTSGMVPVAYTFRKYVVKKKGDPPGTVHLLREDVLIIKPEIPDGCEFVSSYD
jgi:predicted ribosome quality control (RQC) complex YloA/Tae2 family protein